MEIYDEVLASVLGEEMSTEPCEVSERAFSFAGRRATVYALDAGNGWYDVFHIEAEQPLRLAKQLIETQVQWDAAHGFRSGILALFAARQQHAGS